MFFQWRWCVRSEINVVIMFINFNVSRIFVSIYSLAQVGLLHLNCLHAIKMYIGEVEKFFEVKYFFEFLGWEKKNNFKLKFF